MPEFHGNLLVNWKEMCASMARHGRLLLLGCNIVEFSKRCQDLFWSDNLYEVLRKSHVDAKEHIELSLIHI